MAVKKDESPVAGANGGNRTVVSHNTVEVNGIRMHYVSAGAGEPVLLVHGFPETSYAWRKIIPDLSAHYHVIAPDLRGCGESDRPRGSYDKRMVAEDLHQLVGLLNLGAVNLVGHDVGTMVSYAYATAYPAEIRRLVLMEAALPGLGLEELYDASKFPRMWHLGLFEAPNGLAEALITGREKLFVDHFMLQQTYDPSGPDDEALEEYARGLAAPGALRGGIEYFRSHAADAERNIECAKTKLPMPVLTISAKGSFKDVLGPPLQAAAERVQSLEVERCGHYVAEERPDWLIDQLLRFFSEAV